jgi:transposase
LQRFKYFIGVDIASDSFTVSIYTTEPKALCAPTSFPNEGEGFAQLLSYLSAQQIDPIAAVVCLEATGVYAEPLCYFLASEGFAVALEAPHRVKRAFHLSPRKNDAIDSQQIAEYAYRFSDHLTLWQPPQALIEQVRVLLSTREQFTGQLTANQNALKAVMRKVVRTPLAERSYQLTMEHLREQIRSIDREIKNLISKHSTLGPLVALLMSVPGVGLLLAANLMICTEGFCKHLDARQLAAHIGICPLERQSGRCVFKRPRSRQYGPPRLRKLLYLAALSLRTHQQSFKRYFLRKVQEGKSKRLVINNIANKLLKILFAVIKSRVPYIPNYQSVHPVFLKKNLTGS